MATVEISGIDELKEYLDREIGPSGWLTVDQARIDAYAEVSGDHQWIHVDPARAAVESPYGSTIAHGNLTLSLIEGFRPELIKLTGIEMTINYGWDRVRFPAPVMAGSRLRARSRLTGLEEIGQGWWHLVTRFTIETEGGEKPCCVADSLTRLLVADRSESAAKGV